MACLQAPQFVAVFQGEEAFVNVVRDGGQLLGQAPFGERGRACLVPVIAVRIGVVGILGQRAPHIDDLPAGLAEAGSARAVGLALLVGDEFVHKNLLFLHLSTCRAKQEKDRSLGPWRNSADIEK